MNRSTSAVRGLTAVLAAVGAFVVSSPAAAETAGAGLVLGQPFAADSGDRCPAGTTSGTLGWHARPGPLPISVVDVVGTVVDHPTPVQALPACSDPRFTSATFTAYYGHDVVDSESVTVDNGEVAVDLRLGGRLTTKLTPIDEVVVQVCRHAPPGMKIFDYCGKPVAYRSPPSPLV